MRGGGFDGIVQLDVGKLEAADDVFLHLGGKGIPSIEIVEILLHNDVAAAGERRIFGADQRGFHGGLIPRIFGAVDKAEEIAVVEVTESVHLVDRRNDDADAGHDLRRELEAQIHALGANVEQQVARSRNGMARAGANLTEGMEVGGAGISEKLAPRVAADPHDAGESRLNLTKVDRAHEFGQVAAERANDRAAGGIRVDRNHQKDDSASERCDHRLRDGSWGGCGQGRAIVIGLHRMSSPRGGRNLTL